MIGLLSSRVPQRVCSGGLLAAVGAEPSLPPSWHCSTRFLSCSPCTRVDCLSRSVAAQGVHSDVARVCAQLNRGLQQLSRSSAKAGASCSLSYQHAVCKDFASAVVVAQCVNQFVPGWTKGVPRDSKRAAQSPQTHTLLHIHRCRFGQGASTWAARCADNHCFRASGVKNTQRRHAWTLPQRASCRNAPGFAGAWLTTDGALLVASPRRCHPHRAC